MRRNVVAWSALVVSMATLVSSRGLLPKAPAAPEIPAEGQKTAKALSEAFEAVADFIRPSVVQISVQRKAGALPVRPGRRQSPQPSPNSPDDLKDMLKKFFGPDIVPEQEGFENAAEGTGSGFIYDDKGHILTNNHVVANAEKITVTFHDGEEATATVVGRDPASDVAVIKVETTNYRPVLKGQSKKLRVGEWVLAVGSPFGFEQSVTAGIISATERNEVGINQYEAFIQTDASINPGNSGGPLVDMNGRVVGVNSAIVTAGRSLTGSGANAGVGFAIPMDMAANMADKLIKDGKVSRARLGLTFSPLTPAAARVFGLDPKTKGLVVTTVAPGSPAEKAGLKKGDVITKFDSVNIVNGPTLRNAVATSDVGKSYDLTYLRDGQERQASVVPAPEENVRFAFEQGDGTSPRVRSEAPKAEVNDLGLAVQPLTPELASQFGYAKGTEGLVITSVKEGSPADAAGLEPGNLITEVVKDRKLQPIQGVKEFQELVNKADDIALFVKTAESPGQLVTLSKAKKN
jgi:serine protease Do